MVATSARCRRRRPTAEPALATGRAGERAGPARRRAPAQGRRGHSGSRSSALGGQLLAADPRTGRSWAFAWPRVSAVARNTELASPCGDVAGQEGSSSAQLADTARARWCDESALTSCTGDAGDQRPSRSRTSSDERGRRRRFRERRGSGALAGVGPALHVAQQPLGQVDVLAQDRQDRVDRDRLFGIVPGVVVGDEAQAGVGQLRLACQLGLGQVGHADDLRIEALVQ